MTTASATRHRRRTRTHGRTLAALTAITLLLTACGDAGPNSANRKPTITLQAPTQVVAGATVQVKADANDPDGSIIKVTFTPSTGTSTTITTPPYEANVTAPASGSFTVQATATDDQGATTTDTATITTGPNQALQHWQDIHGDPTVDVSIIGLDGLTATEISYLDAIQREMDLGMSAQIAQTYFTNDKRGVGQDVSRNELHRLQWYYDGPPIPYVLHRLKDFRTKVIDNANLAAVDDRISYWQNVLDNDPNATLYEGQNAINQTRATQGKMTTYPAWSRIGIHVEPLILYPELRTDPNNTIMVSTILDWIRSTEFPPDPAKTMGWFEHAGIATCQNVDTKYVSGFGWIVPDVKRSQLASDHLIAVYPYVQDATITKLDTTPQIPGYPQLNVFWGKWGHGDPQGLPWGSEYWGGAGHLADESATQADGSLLDVGQTISPLEPMGFLARVYAFLEVDTSDFTNRPSTPVDNITGFPGVPSLNGNVNLNQIDIYYPYLNTGDDPTLYVGSNEPRLATIQSETANGIETKTDYSAFRYVCAPRNPPAQLIYTPK